MARLPLLLIYAWNDAVLWRVDIKGLGQELKDKLAASDETPDLKTLISLTTRLDNHLRERSKFSRSLPPTFPVSSGPTVSLLEPMPTSCMSAAIETTQLGDERLTRSERQRRLSETACLYCGPPVYFISGCPVRPED